MIFRILLHLYPAEFRNEYGREMQLIYRDMRRERSGVSVWLRLLADTAAAVPRVGWENAMTKTVLIITGVVAAFVLVGGAVTGSFFLGSLLVFGSSALIVGIGFGIARARVGSERVYSARQWPWWSFPAMASAALYVATGVGQLIDDPKKENVFALAVMGAMGGVIAYGLVLRRRGRRAGNWMVAVAVLPFAGVFWLVWPPLVALATSVGAVSEVFQRGTAPPRAA